MLGRTTWRGNKKAPRKRQYGLAPYLPIFLERTILIARPEPPLRRARQRNRSNEREEGGNCIDGQWLLSFFYPGVAPLPPATMTHA